MNVEDADKRVFLLDFINEVYSACDALDIPVPEDIDEVVDLECLLKIAKKMGCRLVPALTVSEVEGFVSKYDKAKIKKLDDLFEKLPVFRLKVVAHPGYPVFYYRIEDGEVFYEALYFPDTKVCLLARFTYQDLQVNKRIGDFDSDTRIAIGSDACLCADIFRS